MKSKLPINVRQVPGEPLRYCASSQEDAGVDYIVDLSAFSGHGECDCKRFRCVSATRIVKGEPIFTDRTSCAHLRACWHHWLKQTLPVAAVQVLENYNFQLSRVAMLALARGWASENLTSQIK